MSSPRFVLFAALLAIACGTRPPEGAALFIKVERGGARSTCVRLSISTGGVQTELGSKPFSASGTVAVGIIQEGTDPELRITAIGGQGAACSPTSPGESASKTFRFPATGTKDEGLTLEASGGDGGAGNDAGSQDDAGASTDGGFDPDGGVGSDGGADAGFDAGAGDAGFDGGSIDAGPIDRDNDGSPAGVDCDDNDPRRFPGNPEQCFGGIDEDCDNQVDCQQASCANLTCGASGVAGTARCQGTTCVELSCGNGADDDLDTRGDCRDSDCDGGSCGGGGTCRGGLCEQAVESNCGDGQDNDGDNQIDCADPDCSGRSCNDGLSCTLGETCNATSCMRTTTVFICDAPPNTACFMPMGTCREPDAGCEYTATPNVGCDDGRRCTTPDRCLADGGCAGTPVTCPMPTSSCLLPGVCVEADGGCFYAARTNGTPCDDGDVCTLGDVCQTGACQAGNPPICTPSSCQTVGPGCLADGGCNFVNTMAGTPCQGGLCDGQGACAPSRFSYPPSNFTDNDLPRDAGPAILITCAAVWTISDAGAVSTSGCATTVPPSRVIDQPGSPDLLLFHGSSMFITDAGSLTLRGGPFAVAFAVTGNIVVAGALDVSAEATSGPGADSSACVGSFGLDGGMAGSTPRGGASGGSFGSVGGTGGNPATAPNVGGAAGVVSGSATLIPLRGGCRGGNGGGVGGGRGGRAGGAIQLSAAGGIRIAGRVTSVGGGGGGGDRDNDPVDGPGGGGGGSGGAILLEGVRVDIQGHVSVNGGSGGEAESANSGVGVPGTSGLPFSTAQAQGGAGASNGGNGGSGAARAGGAGGGQNGQSASAGGGGGGGGVGRIRINSVNACQGPPATMSPQADSASVSCQF